MIKIILTSYKGTFQRQLDYISENAWIYHIKELYIEDNFFQDWVDMKYYPVILDKKENIKLHYIHQIDDKHRLNYDVTIQELVEFYNSNENYYIYFSDLINNFSSDLKYFIQLVNRFEFKKINSQKIGLKETVYIYQSNVLCYYFIINETEQIINHFNQYDRIILQSEEIKKNEDNIIIPSNKYVIYYKKIKN